MFPVSDVIPPRATPYVTIGLIAANSLAFLYQLQLDRQQMSALAHAATVLPRELFSPGMVAGLFVHDGWIHLGGNVLCLWIFGENVEDAMGHGTFVLFYFGAAAIAALAHATLSPSASLPLIGASGAVAAVMGVYFVLYPTSQLLMLTFAGLRLDVIEVPAIFLLGTWALIQLATGAVSVDPSSGGEGLALAADLAGFAAGAAAGLLLRRRKRVWE